MVLLSYIFYGFGFFIFLNSFMNLLRFEKYYFVQEWFDKYQKVTGSRPKRSDFRSYSDYTIYKNRNLFITLEFFWICIGIFTNNWFIFLSLLIMGFILGLGLKKIKFTTIDKLLTLVYLIIKTFIYLFLFVNKFHLDLDIMKMITSFV